MNDESIQVIRDSTRNLLNFNRQLHRDEQTDVGRDLSKIRITSEMVAEISNKLKNKASITASDLHTLKNAIIDDSNNIELVLKNHGSMRGLVREISGIDVRRQVAAAGCCCNLALGDSKACVAIAKAAGSYLVAALDNPSREMAVTCAWTLGNIAGSGTRACEILVAQGALSKLVDMLSSTSDDISDAALYALLHFSYHMKERISKELMDNITRAYSKLNLTMTSSRLLFTLSCNDAFSINSRNLLLRILDSTMVSIEKHFDKCQCNTVCCEFVYLIRTLANICDTENSGVILDYFKSHIGFNSLKQALQSKNNVVAESLFWLLGNLCHFCGDSDFVNFLM